MGKERDNMIKVKGKKVIAMLLLILTLCSTFSRFSFATEISEANLQNKGDCGYHLQYWNADKNGWYYIITTFVTYQKDGVEYPAYCLNKEYPGVGEYDGYIVDIDAVLDNVQIWRTIINGYPYKTPAELGVENKYDAFVATKQAVYSILYGYDPATRYRGGDERGTKIANAVVNLVNIGRYGNQTPSDGTIIMRTSGSLYEEGNYWVQKFNVSSSVDMVSYTVTSTANLPDGAIITNGNGTQTNSFTGGESLYLKIPKSSMNKDISNAIINVQGKCKTYPVFYGKTRINATQNYAVTYDPFGDGVGRGTLNLKTNTGKLQINKTDSEKSKPIQGVTFQLTKADGTVVANATTNSNGVATVSYTHLTLPTILRV
mgnify:FL=1